MMLLAFWPVNISHLGRARVRERADFSKLFAKLELPLFRGQILQYLPHCYTRVGGWEFPHNYVYQTYTFLFSDLILVCIMKMLVIMSNCMCAI